MSISFRPSIASPISSASPFFPMPTPPLIAVLFLLFFFKKSCRPLVSEFISLKMSPPSALFMLAQPVTSVNGFDTSTLSGLTGSWCSMSNAVPFSSKLTFKDDMSTPFLTMHPRLPTTSAFRVPKPPFVFAFTNSQFIFTFDLSFPCAVIFGSTLHVSVPVTSSLSSSLLSLSFATGSSSGTSPSNLLVGFFKTLVDGSHPASNSACCCAACLFSFSLALLASSFALRALAASSIGI
mmetsp:Transcript_23960/g.45062  ORF Transcript_23960/g.45062 Transcript_23960/m.45062 type:complete len:237 (-) Transcript_23960:25-735(-)